MAKRLPNKELATVTELMVSTLATSDALAKLLIEKGLITRTEFMEKVVHERTAYERLFQSVTNG